MTEAVAVGGWSVILGLGTLVVATLAVGAVLYRVEKGLESQRDH